MINVLLLASWYPSRVNQSDGDFVERHAISVSKFVKLTVLFVVKDESLDKGVVEIEKDESKGFPVYRVFYGKTSGGVWEQFFSYRKYKKLQLQLYKTIAEDRGKPDIVHVHIAMKAGLLALLLKRKYGIPYVVTENWTGYYPDSKPSIYEKNFVFRRLNKHILDKAAIFLPVSDNLGKTVQHHFTHVPYTVIPNVVNTSNFFFTPALPATFRFIHPSYLNYQKNPEGMLAACKILQDKGYNFKLVFVGNKDKRLMTMAAQSGVLNQTVFFESFVPNEKIAGFMNGASALLLFSRFENLPCVILEALCCGLPVISTDVGGIPEVIDQSNGLLVESENVDQLSEAMEKMISNYDAYDRKAIAEAAAAKFNYDTVGAAYHSVYRQVIKLD